MKPKRTLIHAQLRAPRAAAVAGILFSIRLTAGFLLLRRSVPADPPDAGAWLRTRSDLLALALNLVPFSGLAFLWFTGVLRDRLGAREDRSFATLFLGSVGGRPDHRLCGRGGPDARLRHHSGLSVPSPMRS